MVFVKCFSLRLMVSGDVFPISWAINKDQNSGSRSGEILLPLRGKKTPLKGSKNFVLIDTANVKPALCGFRIKRKLFCKYFSMSTISGKCQLFQEKSVAALQRCS